MDNEFFDFLKTQVTPRRKKLFEEVAKTRTNHFTVAIEDVGHLHNVSAVMRSCEAFGVQNLHVVEEEFGKRIDREIAMGAQKWTTLHRYNASAKAVEELRSSGYRIVATTPHKKEKTLADFKISSPAALFLGSEANGLSDQLLAEADDFIYIPTYGFTHSLNISVSAAIIIQDLMHRLRDSEVNWQLSEEEQNELQLKWLKKHIKEIDVVIERFEEKKG